MISYIYIHFDGGQIGYSLRGGGGGCTVYQILSGQPQEALLAQFSLCAQKWPKARFISFPIWPMHALGNLALQF